MQFYDEATRIIEQLPKISQAYTKAEVAVGLERAGRPAQNGPMPLPWGLDQQLENLRGQINTGADERTNHFMFKRNGGSYDQKLYSSIRIKIFTAAYRLVGLPLNIELKLVKNLETLRRIDQFIGSIGDESFI